jgi:P-type Cu2+ transporter
MPDIKQNIEECTLCGLSTGNNRVADGTNTFCCHGCHAVYGILSAKNTLDNYKESPIFQQAVHSGLISNPSLLDEIKNSQSSDVHEETRKYYFEINDMWCPSCAEVIRLILLQERGVINCVVDYCTDLASVEYSPRHLSKEDINTLIKKLGYNTQPLQGEGSRPIPLSLLLRFVLAAFCSLNIMMFSYPLYANYFSFDANGYSQLFARLSFIASLPVMTICLWPIIRRFTNSLFVGFIGMEALVLTGVFSAFGLSIYELSQGGTHVYFDSMSVIVTLVLLGKIIETKAKFSSKESLIRLVRSTPKRARKCFDHGEERFVSMKDIAPGDLIKVVTGEKIVLDGEVVSGEGACDESIMTGESLPRKKRSGDNVLGGTLIQRGSLIYRVSANINETTLQKIIDAINLDIGHKTIYIRAADQIVKYIAPTVIFIALLTGGITYLSSTDADTLHQALIRMASVLLISCPCAIGIAAPMAESSMMHTLANLGVLVRNRGCLPLLGNESVFVCDKTGTITEGHFFVKSGLDQLTDQQRSVLKTLTSHSTHPVSVSTFQAINSPFTTPLADIQEISGMGMIGKDQGKTYLFGSYKLLKSQGITQLPHNHHETGDTLSYFCEIGQPIISIALGDKLRDDAAETISSLSPTPTYLLSGDSEAVVKRVAEQCHFTDYKSECHPLEKRQFIDELKQQGKTVCMLGDGINDAPALTAADIGMSVVSATDISIHVSDIVLSTDKLSTIPKLRIIGKRGQKIIKQNLFWAFFYNAIGIGLAAFGYLTPIYAAFAMVTSSLIVIFNAKRIEKND